PGRPGRRRTQHTAAVRRGGTGAGVSPLHGIAADGALRSRAAGGRGPPDGGADRCGGDCRHGSAGGTEGGLMSISPLELCLLFSSLLFCVGLVGALSRSNTILVLLGVELMLNAANINFIAFWRFSPDPAASTGVMFVLFAIAVAAA